MSFNASFNKNQVWCGNRHRLGINRMFVTFSDDVTNLFVFIVKSPGQVRKRMSAAVFEQLEGGQTRKTR